MWASFFSVLLVCGFQKNCKIFVLFYCMHPRFYQKIKIFEIQNFNKIPSFSISFLIFSVFNIFFFSILPIYGFQKNCKILCCFIVWIWDFIKKFCKTMVFFSKKLRYLKSKVSTKFHRLLFLFYFSIPFSILFSISPIQTCPKNYGIFCSILLEGLEILPTISRKF